MVKPTSVPLGAARGADEWAGAGTHYVVGTLDPRVTQSMQLLAAKDFSALLASTFAYRGRQDSLTRTCFSLAQKSGNEKVHSVRSADELLHSGIADYTFLPGEEGVLGRGKFSTVYKVKDSDGQHVSPLPIQYTNLFFYTSVLTYRGLSFAPVCLQTYTLISPSSLDSG